VEFVWHRSTPFRRIVDDDRNKKSLLLGHVVGAIDRKVPLASEISLVASFCISGDHGYEQPAVVDSLANLPIPGVSTAQRALVEPHFDAR
jgi:hypothetical protein